ncbi:hypothetical protein QYE76_072024, partial [Lolium multiflorum]
VNRTLSQLLRSMIKKNLKEWEECLPHVKFAYNRAVHSTTELCPFEVVYGFKPITPLDLLPLPIHERVHMEASKRADYVKKIHEKTKELIEKKGKSNAARMNKKRKEMLFKPGDLVWVHFRKDRYQEETSIARGGEEQLNVKMDVKLDMELDMKISHERATEEREACTRGDEEIQAGPAPGQTGRQPAANRRKPLVPDENRKPRRFPVADRLTGPQTGPAGPQPGRPDSRPDRSSHLDRSIQGPIERSRCVIQVIIHYIVVFLRCYHPVIIITNRCLLRRSDHPLSVVKPNIAMLRESGISPADIGRMCVPNSRLLTCNPDTVKSILERADKLGVPRDSPMFRQAVATTTGLGAETMAAKLKLFRETLGCSAAEVASLVRRNPVLLRVSGEKLRRVMEFLTKVVRVDTAYILARPSIVMYSLETRLAPRYSVMKALQEKHLIRKDHSFYSMVTPSDETFRRRHTHPHKDVLPGLDDAYMAACRGKTAH